MVHRGLTTNSCHSADMVRARCNATLMDSHIWLAKRVSSSFKLKLDLREAWRQVRKPVIDSWRFPKREDKAPNLHHFLIHFCFALHVTRFGIRDPKWPVIPCQTPAWRLIGVCKPSTSSTDLAHVSAGHCLLVCGRSVLCTQSQGRSPDPQCLGWSLPTRPPPPGVDAMGRSCILDSHPGRWMPAAVRMPAVVRMPACHSRRFKAERPIGAATG